MVCMILHLTLYASFSVITFLAWLWLSCVSIVIEMKVHRCETRGKTPTNKLKTMMSILNPSEFPLFFFFYIMPHYVANAKRAQIYVCECKWAYNQKQAIKLDIMIMNEVLL